MTISKEQCRAARGLLGWSQEDLKIAASVSLGTIAEFEKGSRKPYERTLRDLQSAFEEAGIEFIPENGGGVGVRFCK
ncbi:MAG: helix-turn-helix transcriptional regulator [Emcibacter sp.]|nr:helix-turn-helix transcriptional regulator [Emcibacter sp.]